MAAYRVITPVSQGGSGGFTPVFSGSAPFHHAPRVTPIIKDKKRQYLRHVSLSDTDPQLYVHQINRALVDAFIKVPLLPNSGPSHVPMHTKYLRRVDQNLQTAPH
jgi:hypothetical protein